MVDVSVLENPITLIDMILKTGQYKMAYKISDDCIACGACEPECPTDSITAGDPIYVIDPETCIDCGACADVCPVDAPKPE